MLIIECISQLFCGITHTICSHLRFLVTFSTDILLAPILLCTIPPISLSLLEKWSRIFILIFNLSLYFPCHDPLLFIFKALTFDGGKIEICFELVECGVEIIMPHPLFHIKVYIHLTDCKNKTEHRIRPPGGILRFLYRGEKMT